MLLPRLLLAADFTHPNPQPLPELPVAVYKERRERVLKELEGCVAILAAQGETSGVTETFRQDGDFLWLTGINEKDAWLLLAPSMKYNKTVLSLASRSRRRL